MRVNAVCCAIVLNFLDFLGMDMKEAGRRLGQMKERKQQMELRVNVQAMNVLGEKEDEVWFMRSREVPAWGGGGVKNHRCSRNLRKRDSFQTLRNA